MLDFVQTEPLPGSISLSPAEAVRVGIQLFEQRVRIARGSGDQGLGQGRRHVATDAGSRETVEHRQATEVAADAPRANEASEKHFQER